MLAEDNDSEHTILDQTKVLINNSATNNFVADRNYIWSQRSRANDLWEHNLRQKWSLNTPFDFKIISHHTTSEQKYVIICDQTITEQKISQSDDLSSKWSLITPCQNKTVNDYTIADKKDQKNILRSASLKLKRPKIISNHSVFEQRTIWSVNLLIKRSRPKSQPILLFLIIMIFGHPTLEKSDLWSHNRKPLWSLSILFKIKANSDQQVSE